ncbi:MAG: hypothetical protein IAF08_05225 [Rhizobacter sp.]|nr:hypothetical protein [Chlorobiales bacterium]
MMNSLPATPLWTRLCGYSLDAVGAELPFSRRLARDNGWTHSKALRAITEYKRFVYLALTAAHPVTPSDEIDQVWHLHLLYTDSYWNEFCAAVLQSPLHHTPTDGGNREGKKFYDWYERTKHAYATTFGIAPPEDLWPDARVRFGAASRFKRVNTKESWVIAKPEILTSKKLQQRNFVAAAAVLMLLSAVSCSVAASQHQQAAVSIFLILALVLTPIVIAVLWRVNASRKKIRRRRRQHTDIGGVYIGDVGGSNSASDMSSTNAGFGGEGGLFGGGGASSGWDGGDSGGDSGGGDSGGDGGGGCGGGCGGGGD